MEKKKLIRETFSDFTKVLYNVVDYSGCVGRHLANFFCEHMPYDLSDKLHEIQKRLAINDDKMNEIVDKFAHEYASSKFPKSLAFGTAAVPAVFESIIYKSILSTLTGDNPISYSVFAIPLFRGLHSLYEYKKTLCMKKIILKEHVKPIKLERMAQP